ncbi:MAG: glycerophosphodiester phosphodiesterase family protein [Litoreibacter sp.]|uniref:glycerophosphodiester phosphodiesterase family protein n=1 Tax=Litoreibacter sp. TaxID=1969459 RepID=UPI003297CA1D
MVSVGQPSKVTVFGHRGARGIYPENTMAGFRYMREIGVDAVEVDVQNAAGGVPVVAHDPYIAHALTRDGEGAWIDGPPRPVLQASIDQLNDLDVGTIRPGSEYGSRFPDQARLTGERIPTFETFCDWATAEPTLLVNVEIKSHALNADINDPPDVLAQVVVDMLSCHDLLGRSIVSSFDWRVIHACKRLAPDLRRGYLSLAETHGTTMEPNIIDGSPWMDGVSRRDHQGSLPQTIADLGGHVWCPYFEDVTAADVAQAKQCGLRVNVWTVNEPEDIQNMIDMGVDGIITDYPARVQNALAARAAT